mgnify:CR=1 FL=1
MRGCLCACVGDWIRGLCVAWLIDCVSVSFVGCLFACVVVYCVCFCVCE